MLEINGFRGPYSRGFGIYKLVDIPDKPDSMANRSLLRVLSSCFWTLSAVAPVFCNLDIQKINSLYKIHSHTNGRQTQ